ncbi:prolipoprotein diacylglyceryl transferase [Campylobacter sp. FMV-PI01]|uniref:Phosphatidylglycerol--prolipoprotein diacylglyceryl transferase n=1 Tax=Campylobacter portucalensis TaxID=2608384 RepID=A0A6L5WIB8_9BACT|nr:prolipoprotein diacylglyceryl transferase [Campylobacter portucalensis]MSN97018.1 prolipoprotein diacylglyceryl transferase [Campylobacter portucalensis]
MSSWNNIYSTFDPVAFEIFGLKVHWYGLMYVIALILALYLAKYFSKKDKFPFSEKELDRYFIWVEIGVILGARLGYIFIYSNAQIYYLTHPWEIFNPFYNGKFVGISGMSYHGAVIGFILATLFYCKKYKTNVLILLDLVALSIPLAYFFGRVGNFLNQELFGKVTDVSWGIYVDGVLRHPSQIYEGILEGVIIFIILFIYRKYKKYNGELICLYGFLYSVMRFISEIFREPDAGLGTYAFELSMGQILSCIMIIFSLILYAYIIFINKIKTKI